jgi:hypothetical protein
MSFGSSPMKRAVLGQTALKAPESDSTLPQARGRVEQAEQRFEELRQCSTIPGVSLLEARMETLHRPWEELQ